MGDNKKVKPIFLISQPRSGSTFLQALLSSHSKIYSVSEPWLLLHELLPMANLNYEADFDQQEWKKAFDNILSLLPDNEETYYYAVRKKVHYLFSELMHYNEVKARYYLDKTPRYYFILNMIPRVFPDAKIIILKRNPLDVFCSIFNTWVREDWSKFSKYYYDLMLAIPRINNFLQDTHKYVYVLHYEMLKEHTDQEIKKIFKFLNLTSENTNLEKGFNNISGKHEHGDPYMLAGNRSSKSTETTKWQREAENPVMAKLLKQYVNYIGLDKINEFGYNLDSDLPKSLTVSTSFTNVSLEKLLKGEYNVDSYLFRLQKKLMQFK